MAILRPILFMQCNSSNLPLTDTDLMHILMSGTFTGTQSIYDWMPKYAKCEVAWATVQKFIYLFNFF